MKKSRCALPDQRVRKWSFVNALFDSVNTLDLFLQICSRAVYWAAWKTEIAIKQILGVQGPVVGPLWYKKAKKGALNDHNAGLDDTCLPTCNTPKFPRARHESSDVIWLCSLCCRNN